MARNSRSDWRKRSTNNVRNVVSSANAAPPRSSSKINFRSAGISKCNASLILTALATIMLVLQIRIAVGQKVYYTDTFIDVAAKKDMRHLDDYHSGLKFYKEELSQNFNADEFSKRKAKTCIKLINTICPTDTASTIDLHFRSGREKRGFAFLGELLHTVADVPSPEQWHSQVRVTKDLIKLTKAEKTEILNLKDTFEHDRKKLTWNLERIQRFENEAGNMLNITEMEVEELSDRFDDNSRLDHICLNALNFAIEFKKELDLVEDISNNANDLVPSMELFPIPKIRQLITQHSLSDRINNPIYLGKSEILQLYRLQSSATAFNITSRQIHSIMRIPLADFSNELDTYDLSKLDSKDISRLHSLELFTIKRIDRILCSNRNRGTRLLSLSDLKKCQKQNHAHRHEFICEDRQLWLYINSTCENLRQLPDALVSQISHELFAIDHPPDVFTVVCNDHESLLEFSGKISIIKVPKNCSLISKHLTIAKMKVMKDEINLAAATVEIVHTDERHTNLYEIAKKREPKQHLMSNYSSTSLMISHSNFDENDIAEQEMKDDESKLTTDSANYEQDDYFHFPISITSLIIGILLILLIIAILIKFNKRHHNSKIKIKDLDQRDKRNIDDDLKKVKDEVELELFMPTINDMKKIEERLDKCEKNLASYEAKSETLHRETFEKLRSVFETFQLTEAQKEQIRNALT